ncbi:centrosomal and chromosomal factor corto isoform X2 [Lycorma delicatula]|uniref:centrosomal and chromosomal factor corto isoform X2 n=1 Tax=Lycorma delicatula TaxID=130591 RepID=UPI003F517184
MTTTAAAAASCYPDYHDQTAARTSHPPHKDYSRPLHVDCSVEYELPNAAKPPAGTRSEPLLMIHPCYYRRAESQRRSPFINNLPAPRRTTTNTTTAYQSVRYVDPTRPGTTTTKRGDPPLLCSSADSGHWTDTERSPLATAEPRLPPAGPDSGIATPLTDDKSNLTDTSKQSAISKDLKMATLPKPVQREYAAAKRQKIQNTMTTTSTSSTQGSQKNDYHYEMMTGTWVGTGSHHRSQPENVSQSQNQNMQPYYLQLLAATCAGEVNNNTATASTSGTSTSGTGTVGTVSGVGVQGVGIIGSNKESTRLCQPAVGVAAVAASCKACHPQGFLQPQQRAAVQQPWPGVTAPAVASGGGRHRGRAVEPGPEHAATSSSIHRRQAANAAAAAAAVAGVPWARAAKRSRVSTPGTAPWPPACCKACQQWNQDNSRVLWNNDNMLRLFQV